MDGWSPKVHTVASIMVVVCVQIRNSGNISNSLVNNGTKYIIVEGKDQGSNRHPSALNFSEKAKWNDISFQVISQNHLRDPIYILARACERSCGVGNSSLMAFLTAPLKTTQRRKKLQLQIRSIH